MYFINVHMYVCMYPVPDTCSYVGLLPAVAFFVPLYCGMCYACVSRCACLHCAFHNCAVYCAYHAPSSCPQAQRCGTCLVSGILLKWRLVDHRNGIHPAPHLLSAEMPLFSETVKVFQWLVAELLLMVKSRKNSRARLQQLHLGLRTQSLWTLHLGNSQDQIHVSHCEMVTVRVVWLKVDTHICCHSRSLCDSSLFSCSLTYVHHTLSFWVANVV